MKYVFLSLFAVLAYTEAMNYEPEQHGYDVAEANAIPALLETDWLTELQHSPVYRPAKQQKWSKL